MTPATPQELFLRAFEEDDGPPLPRAVHALQLTNTEEVFQLAVAYLRSETARHRARALDVLSQFGAGRPMTERPRFNDSVDLALAHLGDPDIAVVSSAAMALAHLRDERCIAALLGMQGHASAEVRFAVAYGLCGCADRAAIEALMRLMDDRDDDVRDWATFGLVRSQQEGSVIDGPDTPGIRAALHKRLSDSFREARDEAIWLLTQLRDPVAMRRVLEYFETGEWVDGDRDAAAAALGLSRDTPIDELCRGLRNIAGRPSLDQA